MPKRTTTNFHKYLTAQNKHIKRKILNEADLDKRVRIYKTYIKSILKEVKNYSFNDNVIFSLLHPSLAVNKKDRMTQKYKITNIKHSLSLVDKLYNNVLKLGKMNIPKEPIKEIKPTNIKVPKDYMSSFFNTIMKYIMSEPPEKYTLTSSIFTTGLIKQDPTTMISAALHLISKPIIQFTKGSIFDKEISKREEEKIQLIKSLDLNEETKKTIMKHFNNDIDDVNNFIDFIKKVLDYKPKELSYFLNEVSLIGLKQIKNGYNEKTLEKIIDLSMHKFYREYTDYFEKNIKPLPPPPIVEDLYDRFSKIQDDYYEIIKYIPRIKIDNPNKIESRIKTINDVFNDYIFKIEKIRSASSIDFIQKYNENVNDLTLSWMNYCGKNTNILNFKYLKPVNRLDKICYEHDVDSTSEFIGEIIKADEKMISSVTELLKENDLTEQERNTGKWALNAIRTKRAFNLISDGVLNYIPWSDIKQIEKEELKETIKSLDRYDKLLVNKYYPLLAKEIEPYLGEYRGSLEPYIKKFDEKLIDDDYKQYKEKTYNSKELEELTIKNKEYETETINVVNENILNAYNKEDTLNIYNEIKDEETVITDDEPKFMITGNNNMTEPENIILDSSIDMPPKTFWKEGEYDKFGKLLSQYTKPQLYNIYKKLNAETGNKGKARRGYLPSEKTYITDISSAVARRKTTIPTKEEIDKYAELETLAEPIPDKPIPQRPLPGQLPQHVDETAQQTYERRLKEKEAQKQPEIIEKTKIQKKYEELNKIRHGLNIAPGFEDLNLLLTELNKPIIRQEISQELLNKQLTARFYTAVSKLHKYTSEQKSTNTLYELIYVEALLKYLNKNKVIDGNSALIEIYKQFSILTPQINNNKKIKINLDNLLKMLPLPPDQEKILEELNSKAVHEIGNVIEPDKTSRLSKTELKKELLIKDLEIENLTPNSITLYDRGNRQKKIINFAYQYQQTEPSQEDEQFQAQAQEHAPKAQSQEHAPVQPSPYIQLSAELGEQVKLSKNILEDIRSSPLKRTLKKYLETIETLNKELSEYQENETELKNRLVSLQLDNTSTKEELIIKINGLEQIISEKMNIIYKLKGSVSILELFDESMTHLSSKNIQDFKAQITVLESNINQQLLENIQLSDKLKQNTIDSNIQYLKTEELNSIIQDMEQHKRYFITDLEKLENQINEQNQMHNEDTVLHRNREKQLKDDLEHYIFSIEGLRHEIADLTAKEELTKKDVEELYYKLDVSRKDNIILTEHIVKTSQDLLDRFVEDQISQLSNSMFLSNTMIELQLEYLAERLAADVISESLEELLNEQVSPEEKPPPAYPPPLDTPDAPPAPIIKGKKMNTRQWRPEIMFEDVNVLKSTQTTKISDKEIKENWWKRRLDDNIFDNKLYDNVTNSNKLLNKINWISLDNSTDGYHVENQKNNIKKGKHRKYDYGMQNNTQIKRDLEKEKLIKYNRIIPFVDVFFQDPGNYRKSTGPASVNSINRGYNTNQQHQIFNI